jgi:hypothetical protein
MAGYGFTQTVQQTGLVTDDSGDKDKKRGYEGLDRAPANSLLWWCHAQCFRYPLGGERAGPYRLHIGPPRSDSPYSPNFPALFSRKRLPSRMYRLTI